MYKKRCVDCGNEWVTPVNEQECMNCSIERMVQSKIRQQTEDWVRRQQRAQRLAGMPANDRMEICDEDEGGCGLPLVGNSYFETTEDGEKQRICDSCGTAHRVPCPPMMYQMNEKDWKSIY